MNSSRVVVFCGDFHLSPLYLTGAKWEDGRVISGYVENGAWDFCVKGLEVHSKDGPHIVNRWLYNVKHTIEVPEGVRGDYNEIIEWAIGEIK